METRVIDNELRTIILLLKCMYAFVILHCYFLDHLLSLSISKRVQRPFSLSKILRLHQYMVLNYLADNSRQGDPMEHRTDKIQTTRPGDITPSPTKTITVKHVLLEKETVKHIVLPHGGSSYASGEVHSSLALSKYFFCLKTHN